MSKAIREKMIIRVNVITLMCVAYGTLLFLFTALIVTSDKIVAADAWNILEAPLMALIGGTLAISKDLISGDTSSDPKEP